ncbi:hypothetical protein V865_001858 [Kwoniella europaea PYCC6329]|uniref:Uncharacterized protein n=1 Tax=Kwoniella europaea PYCC6329 TaxID=1423913 RepID=A0AAX4KDP2_9TREE
MTMAAQPTSPFQPFYTPFRKRRALSPPSLDTSEYQTRKDTNDSDLKYASPLADPSHRDKRRRPNLANGFQGLSISVDQSASNLNDDLPRNGLDDDEGIGLQKNRDNDVTVEVLPDKASRSTNHHHHHHSNTHHWSIPSRAGPSSPSSSSTSPTTSSEEDYHPFQRHRRYAGVAQQADEIVQPDQVEAVSDLSVEDVTVVSPRNGRRRREDDTGMDNVTNTRNRRARTGDDFDVEMNAEEEVEEIGNSDHDKRRRRKTEWHEPEKDRIIITSLSDASSSRESSRSASPEPAADDVRNLSQPGMRGFTISPSLLTHLLKTQRDQLSGRKVSPTSSSLILYRPLGIPPGEWNDDIVKAWKPDEEYVDSGRFEMLDDDEVFDEATPSANGDTQMDIDGDVEMA